MSGLYTAPTKVPMRLPLLIQRGARPGTGLARRPGWRTRSSRFLKVFAAWPAGKQPGTLPSPDASLRNLRILANNLVNALARKFKLICYKAQRFPSSMQIQNLRVSVRIRRRPWTQRSPLPVANLLESLNAVAAQLPLAATLSKVTNPGAERQRLAVDVFDVSGRDSTVPLPLHEPVERSNCKIETRDVVHGKDNSKRV